MVSEEPGLAGVEVVLLDVSRDESSTLCSGAPSAASPGICTESFGLLACMLFTRDGAGMLPVEACEA